MLKFFKKTDILKLFVAYFLLQVFGQVLFVSLLNLGAIFGGLLTNLGTIIALVNLLPTLVGAKVEIEQVKRPL